MFQHLTGNEVKKLFEVSKLWNEIASGSKKCGEKLKLTISTDDNAKKLKSIKESGTKSATLILQSSEGNHEFIEILPLLLLDVVTVIGWNLKELKVLCTMDIEAFKKILSSSCKLESLSFQRINISTDEVLAPLQLPKLKELKGDSLQNQFLELFRNVSTLKTFNFESVNGENIDKKLLEDFILRQDKLKNFVLSFSSNRNQLRLFKDKNRLNEMNFQLESIGTTACMIHPNNAVDFFNRQQNLKTVDLGYHRRSFVGTPEEHRQKLQSILTLPNLERLKISERNFMNDDWIALRDIRNASVKFLEMKLEVFDSSIHGELVEMFPNLHQISVTPDHPETSLRLFNFQCEKLSMIHCPNLSSISFEPPLINFDRVLFEDKLMEFMLKHRQCKQLFVGRREWIGMDVKLSMEFWEKILRELPNLAWFIINHPGDLNELVNIFNNAQSNFDRFFSVISIRTNDIGEESVRDIEKPVVMNISLF